MSEVKYNSKGQRLVDPPFRIVTADDAQKVMVDQANKAREDDPKQHRMYLIMWVYNDGSGDKGFEFVQGQANARQLIKNLIDQIDIKQSFIINEVTPFGEDGGKPSIYTFMKALEPYYNDGFLIDEYLEADTIDKEFERMQNMTIGDLPEINTEQQIQNTLAHYESEGN